MIPFSSLTRRHSTEVLADPRVAGAIALPQTPSDPPRGVQFEGTCRLLGAPEDVERARRRYAGRIFPDDRIDELLASPDRPHRFFGIRPTRFVLFDAVNFPEESRRELTLGPS